MSDEDPPSISDLYARWQNGDNDAGNELFRVQVRFYVPKNKGFLTHNSCRDTKSIPAFRWTILP